VLVPAVALAVASRAGISDARRTHLSNKFRLPQLREAYVQLFPDDNFDQLLTAINDAITGALAEGSDTDKAEVAAYLAPDAIVTYLSEGPQTRIFSIVQTIADPATRDFVFGKKIIRLIVCVWCFYADQLAAGHPPPLEFTNLDAIKRACLGFCQMLHQEPVTAGDKTLYTRLNE
jgi:hypothetical protein